MLKTKNKIINYIDLGLHKGDEIELFLNAMNGFHVNVFGFEAHPDLYSIVKNRYKSDNRVLVYNFAVSNKMGTEKLYLAPENDLEGSSIFKTKNNVDANKYFEVECIKLSDWINENLPNFKNDINVLRMNIEGAELYVIRDLVDSGLYKYIDLYLGSTKNDILKCSEIAEKNDDHQELMRKNSIKIYPYCKADINRLTDEELKILIIYKVPPLRLIFKALKNKLGVLRKILKKRFNVNI